MGTGFGDGVQAGKTILDRGSLADANAFLVPDPRATHPSIYQQGSLDRALYEKGRGAGRVGFAYPETKTIHLVMDNLNNHRKKPLTDLYGAEFGGEIRDRFTVHYTPTHGSWLNQAEIEIGIFSHHCWEPEEYATWRHCAAKPELGIDA